MTLSDFERAIFENNLCPEVHNTGIGYVDPNRVTQGGDFVDKMFTSKPKVILQTPKENTMQEEIVNVTDITRDEHGVLHVGHEEPTKARGQTPHIIHYDEPGYLNTVEGEVGPTGEAGLPGDDDSALSYSTVAARKKKRKKSKPKSKHLPNCKSRLVKATLGSAILGMLGKVQQDTSDAIKKEVLKTMPMSEFAEIVGGKELPAYQKRLVDLMQARAEGSLKPELKEALGEDNAKLMAQALQPLYDHTIKTADRDTELSVALYPTLEEKGLTEAPLSGTFTEAPIQ